MQVQCKYRIRSIGLMKKQQQLYARREPTSHTNSSCHVSLHYQLTAPTQQLQDGMIKCEPLASPKQKPRSDSDSNESGTAKRRQAETQFVERHQYQPAATKNKTIEYLKSILGSEFNPPTPTPTQPAPSNLMQASNAKESVSQ